MKYYTHDSVNVSYDDDGSSGIELILKLQKEGWKNLQYVTHNSWGDCRSPEVIGQRPMTINEIKDADKAAEKHRQKELDALHKMAKKLGYDIVKRKGK